MRIDLPRSPLPSFDLVIDLSFQLYQRLGFLVLLVLMVSAIDPFRHFLKVAIQIAVVIMLQLVVFEPATEVILVFNQDHLVSLVL